MLSIGGHTEIGALERVFLKHSREAFPPDEALASQWKDLGYHRKPDRLRAMDEHDALVDLLERLGARVDLFPSHPDTGMDSGCHQMTPRPRLLGVLRTTRTTASKKSRCPSGLIGQAMRSSVQVPFPREMLLWCG